MAVCATTAYRPLGSLLDLIRRERLRLGASWLMLLVTLVIGYLVSAELSPLRLIVAVCGAFAVPMVLIHVDLGVLLLLAILWARVSDIAIAFYGAPSIATPLTVLLAVGWLGQKLIRERQLSAAVLRPLAPVSAFVLVNALSLTWTENVSYTRTAVEIMVKDVAIYWVVVEVVSAYRLIRPAALTLVLATSALAIAGVHQYATDNYASNYGGFAQSAVLNIVGDVDSYRLGGPMNSPNPFANLLLTTVPLGMALLRTTRSRLAQMALVGMLGATCLAVLLTYSRSGLLLLGLVVALSLPRHRLNGWHVLLALVIMAAAIWFAPARVWERAGTLVAPVLGGGESRQFVDDAVELRVGAEMTALEIFYAHPIVGSGVGTYPVLYQDYSRWLGLKSIAAEFYAHNRYLEVLAETGLVGLLTFGAMLVLPLVRLRRVLSQLVGDDPATDREREMLYGVAIAFIGNMGAMIFIHADYPRFFWILLALVVAAANTRGAAATVPLESSGSRTDGLDPLRQPRPAALAR